MKTHRTLTGGFDTRSAIHWLRENVPGNHIAAMRERASQWDTGNAIGVQLANKWFQAEAGDASPANLAADYLKAKEAMISAVFAVQ